MPPLIAFDAALLDWLAGGGFVPRGRCGPWPAWLAWTWIASNAAIALAYFAIPASIAYVWWHRRGESRFGWMALAFVAFITLCGLTHVTEITVFYWPGYPAYAALYALTAAVSLFTAATLPRVAEFVRRQPSRAEVDRLNAELQVAVAGERRKNDALQRKLDALERQAWGRVSLAELDALRHLIATPAAAFGAADPETPSDDYLSLGGPRP